MPPFFRRDKTLISPPAARDGGDESVERTLDEFFISIHAAREGGDLANMIRNSHFGHFNPRRP